MARDVTKISIPAGLSAVALFMFCADAHATVPLPPTITWPPAGSILSSARPDITWSGSANDAYEVHIGWYNSPTSAEGWDSGVVGVGESATGATTPPLAPNRYYYLFIRLHNAEGWGPWSAHTHYLYVAGELLNDPYLVAGPDGLQWRHTMCYNPDRNEYLISWNSSYIIYYYRLDATGAKIGSAMYISDDLGGHHRSSVCYNSARKEYLIAYSGWTDYDNQVRTLRVDAATGNPIGGPTWIASTSIVFAIQVAYSTINDSYLLTWEDYAPGIVRSIRLNTTSIPTGTVIDISASGELYCRNQSIAWNSAGDEYLVTFQGLTTEAYGLDHYGQRVRASDGALIGSNFVISAELGTDGPGGVAYDSDMNRYLVVYEGGGPSPWGQFVSASGTLIGDRFAVGSDDLAGVMTNVAWNAVTKEYLATWAHCCSASNYGRRISQAGACIGEPFRTNGDAIGIGNWSPMSVVNPTNGEFLIYWFCSYSQIYTRRYQTYPLPPPDTQAPDPVTTLSLSRYPTSIGLSWTNPSTSDFSATMIRVKVGSPPSSKTDGMLVVDQGNAPGTADGFTHTGLTKGTTYCYAAFAHDLTPNYADAVTDCATVMPGDFNGDNDIDQEDFGHFQACLAGDAVPYGEGCQDADLNEDGHVDGADFDLFQACMAGPNRAPGC